MTDLKALTKSNPPTTVAEAVDRLLDILDEDDQHDIAGMSKNELIDLHFGLGMGVRNAWLWKGNDALLDDCEKYDKFAFEPDSCSGVITRALWKRLRA